MDAASPSCPRCEARCPAGAIRCGSCGFALIDTTRRRRRGGAALAAAGTAAAVVAVVLVGGRDGPADSAAPAPPEPVSALEAERRLELRFGGESDDETAAVRCPRGIEPGQLVRCELRYPDGIPRAMLVRLSPRGELEADIPYPATLRR